MKSISNRLHFINNKNDIQINSDTQLFIIDGRCCKTTHDLFIEFSKVLNFPTYFGFNWSAFEDCLFNLEWIKKLYNKNSAYIYITNFKYILMNNLTDKEIFCKIINTDYIVDKSNPEHLMQYPIDIQFFILNEDRQFYIENDSVVAWNGYDV